MELAKKEHKEGIEGDLSILYFEIDKKNKLWEENTLR
jgi:hypothetical protein